MMAQGGWIAFGGALGIWFSPDAALFAGVVIFLAGWLEGRLKRRRRHQYQPALPHDYEPAPVSREDYERAARQASREDGERK